MSYRFKKGDRVICVFTKTTDDQGRYGFARVGKVVETSLGKDHEYVVDFGRGFQGWYDMDRTHATLWYVSEDELGFWPRKRSAK